MIVSSTEFWKGLPEDQRAILAEALQEATLYGNGIAASQDLEDRQRILDSRRTEIITLTDAERAQWVDAMRPVWQKFEEEIGRELIDAAYAANN